MWWCICSTRHCHWRRVGSRAVACNACKRVDLTCFLLLFPSLPMAMPWPAKHPKSQQAIDFSVLFSFSDLVHSSLLPFQICLTSVFSLPPGLIFSCILSSLGGRSGGCVLSWSWVCRVEMGTVDAVCWLLLEAGCRKWQRVLSRRCYVWVVGSLVRTALLQLVVKTGWEESERLSWLVCGGKEDRSGLEEDKDAAAGDREEVVVRRVCGRRREVLVLGGKIQSQRGRRFVFGRDREWVAASVREKKGFKFLGFFVVP